MRTILKWVGSKSRMTDRLDPFFAAAKGTRLVEPFAGSCSIVMNTDYPEYLIGDSNPDLISMYREILTNQVKFTQMALELFQRVNTPENYYKCRDEFNNAPDGTRRAALFLYLNRHCFNGLCRYSKRKGEFNVPHGRYKTIYFPHTEIFEFVSKVKEEYLHCGDWLTTLQKVRHGDVVYIDPPYIPVNSKSFTNYTGKDFSAKQHTDLRDALLDMGQYGIPIIVSNSASDLTKELYKDFDVHTVIAPRSVGGQATAKEIIATLNVKI